MQPRLRALKTLQKPRPPNKSYEDLHTFVYQQGLFRKEQPLLL
ncbi:hypothetical protein ABIE28_000915 [Devosia sp. 2618]